MHRQEAHAGISHSCNRARDRFRDVVELQVEKNLVAVREQTADKIHTGGRVQLEPYLVKVDARSDATDERAGIGGGLYIERDNDRVVHGFGCHITRIGLAARSVTRPIGNASVNFAASCSGSEISSPPAVCGS